MFFLLNNKPEDAVFLEELKALENKNLHFKLIAIMTHMEKSQQPWQGEIDYINHDMLTKYIKDLTISICYISGLPAMVATMRKVLNASSVDVDTIRIKEFPGYEPLAKEKGITEDVASNW